MQNLYQMTVLNDISRKNRLNTWKKMRSDNKN